MQSFPVEKNERNKKHRHTQNNQINSNQNQQNQMATFNATTTTNSANVLSSSVAAATATFIVPSTTTTATVATTPLQLEPFGAIPGHTQFVNAATPLHHHHHQTNSSTSSYTFVQIKREPCQVSEISSNNCNLQQQQHQHQQHHHHHHQQHQTASTSLTATGVGTVSSSSVTASASSKTMSSSTLTTLVKIEASSPKVPDMDKQTTLNASLSTTVPTMAGTSNSVPVGIAVARKRPQESSSAALNGSTSMPLQQSLNKDMNCYGIRVADLGGVGTGCGNIYFTGNGDLMTSSATAEELALSAAGVQNVNRAPSTFWPYQNALPIESVISMSPATVGLQYSRDASRGQVVLLPATPAALDPFQQPAAAFVWPSAYIPQATAATAPSAAAAALQPPPNFLFPSMGTHSTLNATPSYATSLQLYLAAAAGSSTLCQHTNQQMNTSSTSTTNSINLSLGNGATSSCTSSSSSSTSSRFLSLAATAPPPNATDLSAMLPRQTPSKQMPIAPLLLPPTAMKIEEYNSTEFKHTTLATHPLPPPQTTALNFETRDKTTTTMTATTNLLQLQPNVAQQALNLVRLPTPPTSATIDSVGQQSHQILFPTGPPVHTPTLLNLSAATATPPSIGPLTPAPCDDGALNFKTTTPLTPPQIVIGVPRVNAVVPSGPPSQPQMQDVNIQTDTPVCSEDENSFCPLSSALQQPAPESPKPIENGVVAVDTSETQQPLELTKPSESVNECHNIHATSGGHADAIEPPAIEAPPMALEPQRPAEDLTGLELLSNISTNSTPFVRVKQEPQELPEPIVDAPMPPIVATMPQQTVEIMPPVEPLGGLNLLCALAEQRIQEEEVQGSLFATPSTRTPTPPETSIVPSAPPQPITPTCFAFPPQTHSPGFRLEPPLLNGSSPFPSMDGIELPTTLGLNGGEQSSVGTPVKRKKHKHSKSSSSASDSRRSTQRCSKKSKKKRKHKQAPLSPNELDINDEQLQVELRSALNTMDPSYKRLGQWPNPQQLFKIMESNMRMRLADINRQYQKKKRKLDEMSKHKKKKKCSKLTQQQQQQLQLQLQPPQQPQLTLTSSLSSLHTGSTLGTSSPLRDYKFSTFSISSNGPSTNGLSMGSTSSYLQPSSFLRFQDKTHAFPPPPTALMTSKSTNNANDALPSTSTSTSSFVRLEPSALDAANNRCSSAAASNGMVTLSATASSRLAHKHASSEKSSQKHASKERKLMSLSRATTPSLTTSTTTTTVANLHQSNHALASNMAENDKSMVKPNPFDKELQLTSEHLYREETRVLTDMGGLFYAGVMKPLQPPDVYAVTLDGERGNKSHIMSREEILKDTILEVAPKSVESVPVGTRLCAYWSQQYRCLYPGRAIESEALDDGAIAQDFVSVEFDDGDSGRIRLQNIRLLLSDYPIVEYNDNPLYSLGKQKKSAIKSDEHNSLSGDDHHSHHGFAMSSDNTTSLAATMELFTQRSEKKRLKKSLKKKTQNDETAASTVVAPNDNGIGNIAAPVDGNESNRKHHKHKKRKKHKKHHRKAAEAESQNYLRTCDGTVAKAFVGKREVEAQEDNDNDDEQMNNDENLAGNDETLADNDEADEEQEVATVRRVASSIKQEASIVTASTPSVAATAAGIKVKTEQLDMEEETTSNMMSEVSDEAKGDEVVEHNNAKGSSKIAAFLPERQLWGWYGTAYRKAGVKGRARKQFYKTIKRGKETISVGDCAVFLSTGRPDRPYIGRIESMWETTSGNKVVRVRWFYHPEETSGCPNLKYPGALFESPHEDENDVQTISHRCEVLEFLCYFNKFGADSKQYQSIYDNNDTYYLAGYYNPRLLVLKLQDDIPTLEELQNTTDV